MTKLQSSAKEFDAYYNELVKVCQEYIPIKKDPSGNEENSVQSLFKNPMLQRLIRMFPGVLCLANIQDQSYIYMSENIKDFIGYDKQEFYDKGLGMTISLLHPSQNEVILGHVFPKMFEYFTKYSYEGRAQDILVSYPSALRDINGVYKWYLHKSSVVLCDEAGRPFIIMKVVFEINDIKKDNIINLNISLKEENQTFTTVYEKTYHPDLDPNAEQLSKRELEVLYHLSQGKSSKEISESLFISEHTVNSHRKNMMRKMEVKRTAELVKKGIANGLIAA